MTAMLISCYKMVQPQYLAYDDYTHIHDYLTQAVSSSHVTAQALYFSKITAEPPHKVLRCCTVRGKECIQKLHCSLFLWL